MPDGRARGTAGRTGDTAAGAGAEGQGPMCQRVSHFGGARVRHMPLRELLWQLVSKFGGG
jgi:hypothetical protein